MNNIASRVKNIKPSPTLAVSAKAKELKNAGHDIIDLSVGEPDFDTPEHIKQAAISAIQSGKTKYTAVGGIPELKQAIIDKLQRDNQLSYRPEQILVSCGAKQSIFNLMQAMLDLGDEVIIPTPYWVSYPDMAKLASATPVMVTTSMEENFKLTPQALQNSITSKTKLLILNSPSNPTGMVYSKQELDELGKVLQENPHVYILSDDIYEHITWADEQYHNLAMVCPELKDRMILINGVSKAYAMTGWRIGYTAAHQNLIKAMSKIQSQSTSSPCSISQYAATAALNGPQSCIAEMLDSFKERHDYITSKLNDLPGITCRLGQGAFYVFFNAQTAINNLQLSDDIEFANYLLEKTGIALVPGSAFGSPGYLRLSFAADLSILEQAIDKLKQTL